MRQVAYVLVGVLVGFILAGSVFIVTRLPSGKPIALEPSPTKVPMEVHVVGGVVRPGVYILPEGSRITDAIDAAGGLLAETDTGSINLAEKLQDGQQLVIPGGTTGASPNSNTVPFTVLPTSPAATSTVSVTLLNINTASVSELDSLPGIGPSLAEDITTYRDQNGPFARIEDIMNVPGIGVSTFDQIRSLITVGP